jgi:hypothetical protein
MSEGPAVPVQTGWLRNAVMSDEAAGVCRLAAVFAGVLCKWCCASR